MFLFGNSKRCSPKPYVPPAPIQIDLILFKGEFYEHEVKKQPSPYFALTLSPYGDETDDLFFDISMTVIQRLLQSYHTITQIIYWDDPPPRKRFFGKTPPAPDPFLLQFQKSLSCEEYPETRLKERGRQLLIGSFGCPSKLLNIYEEQNPSPHFNQYGYRRKANILEFEQDMFHISTYDFDIHFEFVATPNYLYIVINTQVIPLDMVKEVVAEVSLEFGKKLTLKI